MNTIEILEEIYNKSSEIDKLLFYHFPKQKLLQDRINFDELENIHFQEALNIRDKYKLPFWDSMMLTYFGKNKTSKDILKCALYHNKLDNGYWTSDFNYINKEIQNNVNLAFNSKVKLKTGSFKYLPLLDFHIPNNEENLCTVKKVISLLGLSEGYILDSGESFHFIGNKLIEYQELIEFLSKALLFSPIIDRAWIAHQLLEKAPSLRIGYKHNQLPTLILKL